MSSEEQAGTLKRAAAETFGTFGYVLMAAGPEAVGGFDLSTPIGRLGTALATGFAVAAMLYMIGPISGAHINPAVTIGFISAGRFPRHRIAVQIASQFLGAILGAALIAAIAAGAPPGVDVDHLGATGWRWSPGYPWWAAFLAETGATFVFVTTFLTIRHEKQPTPIDGLAIGLTVAALHIAFIAVSGASINPARSLGPALFAGGSALAQLWLYLLAPSLGAVLAGVFARALPLNTPKE